MPEPQVPCAARSSVLGLALLAGLFGTMSVGAAESKSLRISEDRLQEGRLALHGPWLYLSGDDLAWAASELDDGSWLESPTRLEPGETTPGGWTGIGWFRLHLEVDDELWAKPLALVFHQSGGASEVFLDGARIARLGRVGRRPHEEEGTRQYETVWISFSPRAEHVLAVRHSDFLVSELHALDQVTGFEVSVAAGADAAGRSADFLRRFTAEQALFTGVPLVFCVLHLLFFVFEPRSREHFYFALITLSFAGAAFIDYQHQLSMKLSRLVLLRQMMGFFFCLLILSGLLWVYALLFERLPRRFWFFAAGAGVIVIAYLLEPGWGMPGSWLLTMLVFLELIRHLPVLLRRRREGAWILGVGFMVFLTAALLDGLIDYELLNPAVLGTTNPYLYGGLFLLLSMSFYLARNAARTNRRLERKLVQVRELSEQMLAQERAAREQEISRRLLEADHARKTEELEEARQLQLALLPQGVPSTERFEIAASMQTATEVGGDYYDFDVGADGTLTLAIGDAVGHGARAGTLVAATKSLFSVLAGRADLVDVLGRFNEALRGMRLKRVHMALTLARFRDGRCEITAAGMPPALVLRAATGRVEEISLPGMPLGSSTRHSYRRQEVALDAGDAVLFMSDGFPELVNDRGEVFGYDRVRALYEETRDRSAETVLQHLRQAAETWAGGAPPQDDVTFVVVKVREHDGVSS